MSEANELTGRKRNTGGSPSSPIDMKCFDAFDESPKLKQRHAFISNTNTWVVQPQAAFLEWQYTSQLTRQDLCFFWVLGFLTTNQKSQDLFSQPKRSSQKRLAKTPHYCAPRTHRVWRVADFPAIPTPWPCRSLYRVHPRRVFEAQNISDRSAGSEVSFFFGKRSKARRVFLLVNESEEEEKEKKQVILFSQLFGPSTLLRVEAGWRPVRERISLLQDWNTCAPLQLGRLQDDGSWGFKIFQL